MATRTFADLSPYRRAVSNAQGTANLLDTILGGIQQGVQLQRLPQTLQSQDIAQQLQNAINLQKLQDLQNPQAAIARDLTSRLTLEGALNPNKGLFNLEPGLGTIGTPGAITAAQQATLPTALTPSTVLPTAPVGIPVTEVAPFGIGTGVYSDPSIPLAEAQRASDAEMNQLFAELQAKSQTEVDTAASKAAALEPFEQRKFQREADLKRGLSDTEFTNQMKVLEARHQNALVEGDRDSANRLANEMAVLTEKSKATTAEAQSPYQKERQTRILGSIGELRPLVGSKTVGLASLLRGVPTTDALNFSSKLDSLKASIAFGELTAMREASKTGGALGQVSNVELNLLENALGSLNQAQTPKQFLSELDKIEGSIKRWQEAASKAGAPSPSGSTVPNIKSIRRVN